MKTLKNTFLLWVLLMLSCGNATAPETNIQNDNPTKIDAVVGANRTADYFPMIKNKKLGVVANQTSVIFNGNDAHSYIHLVDSLQNANMNIMKVFAPEHGFRGTADAGEYVKDGIDSKSGLPIISLYGKNKKPSAEQLSGIDLMIFDIQDVGARFYTYISTLHYIMEACAENDIPVLVLDRPNPNGHYLDGPILEKEHSSFVGMHEVPVVHGMTIGEYAQMINGEGWLNNGIKADLKVIEIQNWKRANPYSLPIKPSPNLPNDRAINLYPSLCFFEGTNVNAGRGTEKQFQVYGSPYLNPEYFEYTYIPISNEGAKYPKHQNVACYGEDLTEAPKLKKIDLNWLIKAYEGTENKDDFFNPFFAKLAGTETLEKQIRDGYTANEIRKSWLPGLKDFEKKRAPYLLYGK